MEHLNVMEHVECYGPCECFGPCEYYGTFMLCCVLLDMFSGKIN